MGAADQDYFLYCDDTNCLLIALEPEYTRQLNTNEKTRGKSPYAGTIPVTYFQKCFINSRLIILLISGIKHILLLLTSNSHSITVGAYGFN